MAPPAEDETVQEPEDKEDGGRPGWVKGTEEKADRAGETKDLSSDDLRKLLDEG